MDLGSPVSPKALFWLIVIVLAIGGGLTIWQLSQGSLGASESLLLSVILTIASVGIGWLISHTLYHDSRKSQISEIRSEYERNLEVYAVKASEKVINLSNQIARVIEYLSEEAEAAGDGDATNLKHRRDAAIHMLGTLKSINDTSLSDWEGVIGDRLDAKRKIDQQRDYDINAILEELRGLTQEVTDVAQGNHVTDLVKELRRVSSYEAALPPSRRATSYRELSCPECGSLVRLKANRQGKIAKTASTCLSCKTQLAVIGGSGESARLEQRAMKSEKVDCPACSSDCTIILDNASPSVTRFKCGACGIPSVAHRLHAGGMKVRIDVDRNGAANEPNPLTQEFLDQVEMMLPAQPWPTGVHKDIAEKLSCTPAKVSRATNKLISEGKFMPQHDGKVLEAPQEDGPSS